MNEPVELTILMPCLNEAETLARCIEKAKLGIEKAGVCGEIIVADNGSTDGSLEIAAREGVGKHHLERGFGSRWGFCNAKPHDHRLVTTKHAPKNFNRPLLPPGTLNYHAGVLHGDG